MKQIFTLVYCIFLLSCGSKIEDKPPVVNNSYEVDSLKAVAAQAQEELKTLKADKVKVDKERKSETEKSMRAKVLQNVFIDEKTAFDYDSPGFFGTATVNNVSTTISNATNYSLSDVEVSFIYYDHNKKETDFYIAKIGNLGPKENRLVQAPKKEAYTAAAYISQYSCKKISMCFKSNYINQKTKDAENYYCPNGVASGDTLMIVK